MNPMTADSFARYRQPVSLKGSPGGGLCWLQKEIDLKDNRTRSDVWLLRQNTPLRLTACGEVKDFWWRDDLLVFSSLREERDKRLAEEGLPLTVLYTLPTRLPGEAQLWLRLPYEVEDILFLPDGDMLVQAKYDPVAEAVCGDAPSEEEAAKRLRVARGVSACEEIPFWEDGAGYTGGSRGRLYLYSDGDMQPLTDRFTAVSNLQLAPSGEVAFFVASRYEGKQEPADRLMMLRLGEGKPVPADITFDTKMVHHNYAAVDDDTLLVYGCDMQEYGLNGNGSFYLYSLSSKSLRTLDDSGAHCGYNAIVGDLCCPTAAKWIPSQAGVYWVDTLGESSHLMHIGLDGSIAQVTQTEGAVMELAAAGEFLYITAMRGLEGPEVYRVDVEGNEERVSSLNTALKSAFAPEAPQPLRCVNSEGTALQGWVLPPANHTDGALYPAVLLVHGGPKMAYGSILTHEAQYLAAQGYGVVFCNPTGSDGRGDVFADVRGGYGGRDAEDLLLFLDAALEAHSWMDASRLGVMGGSYGGFMVNWLISHTRRFNVAVSERGISNWASMLATSDIGYYFVPDQTSGDLWEDAVPVWRQSPMQYADKVQTPTLFIAGEDDARCPVGETQQMFTALKIHGVAARLCVFHGESHQLPRAGKPQNRVRRLKEISAWLKRYIDKPAPAMRAEDAPPRITHPAPAAPTRYAAPAPVQARPQPAEVQAEPPAPAPQQAETPLAQPRKPLTPPEDAPAPQPEVRREPAPKREAAPAHDMLQQEAPPVRQAPPRGVELFSGDAPIAEPAPDFVPAAPPPAKIPSARPSPAPDLEEDVFSEAAAADAPPLFGETPVQAGQTGAQSGQTAGQSLFELERELDRKS